MSIVPTIIEIKYLENTSEFSWKTDNLKREFLYNNSNSMITLEKADSISVPLTQGILVVNTFQNWLLNIYKLYNATLGDNLLTFVSFNKNPIAISFSTLSISIEYDIINKSITFVGVSNGNTTNITTLQNMSNETIKWIKRGFNILTE